jgi:hypothetical protein
MNKHYYAAQTYLHRDGRPTDFGESRTDISGRLDHSRRSTPTSVSTRPFPDDSAPGSEEPRSTAGLVFTHLLAVLVVVMVVTSMLGFTIFDHQGGNSATAIVSLAIGGTAAVLGLIFGFREAHQAE